MSELGKLAVLEGTDLKISGRELHEFLEVKTPYRMWFPRILEYGFAEGTDFLTSNKNVRRADGVLMPHQQHDHLMTVDMAKEISMLQRTEKGKMARQYFIQLEKDWNSPEKVMARALIMANNEIETVTLQLEAVNKQLDTANKTIEAQEPMVIFANSVSTSKTSILVGELAKLLCQNGINIGQNRLFAWLRDNGYLIKSGSSRNIPTQRAIEAGLFEIKESCYMDAAGMIVTKKTPKVTGKGQVYFINKFLKEKNKLAAKDEADNNK